MLSAKGKPSVGLQYSFSTAPVVVLTGTVGFVFDSKRIEDARSHLAAVLRNQVQVSNGHGGSTDVSLQYLKDNGSVSVIHITTGTDQSSNVAFTADLSGLSRSELVRAFKVGPNSGSMILTFASDRPVTTSASSKPFWTEIEAVASGLGFVRSAELWQVIPRALDADKLLFSPRDWQAQLTNALGTPEWSKVNGSWSQGWELSSTKYRASLVRLASKNDDDVDVQTGQSISSMATIDLSQICSAGSTLAVNLDGGQLGCDGL